MKILLRIVLGILALIVLLLIVALFISKDFTIEREIVINKPQQQVYDYVKVQSNQPNFNPFIRMDPDIKLDAKGTDGTVGYVYAWKGKKSGAGEMEITKLTEGQRVDMSIHFIEPFDNKGEVYFDTEKVSETSTKVKWGMKGSSPYPMNLITAIMKGSLESDYDKGLALMKADLEKK